MIQCIPELTLWKDNNVEIVKNHIIVNKDPNCKWGRLLCQWNEQKDGRVLKHCYAATLNLKNGDLYLDCSPKKIYAKCIALLFARPIEIGIKFAYHLILPISFFDILARTINEEKKHGSSTKKIVKECLINIGKSVLDIVRTPIYGTALTITVLAAVIIGPFAPNKLYDIRELEGNIEQALVWDESIDNYFFLAPCFLPVNNILDIDKSLNLYEGTLYENNPKLQGMSNLASSLILSRRNNYNPFDQLIGTLDPNKVYKSSVLI